MRAGRQTGDPVLIEAGDDLIQFILAKERGDVLPLGKIRGSTSPGSTRRWPWRPGRRPPGADRAIFCNSPGTPGGHDGALTGSPAQEGGFLEDLQVGGESLAIPLSALAETPALPPPTAESAYRRLRKGGALFGAARSPGWRSGS